MTIQSNKPNTNENQLVSFRIAAYSIIVILAIAGYWIIKKNKPVAKQQQCNFLVHVQTNVDYSLDQSKNNVSFQGRLDRIYPPIQAHCQSMLGRIYLIKLSLDKQQLTSLLTAKDLRVQLQTTSRATLFGIQSFHQWKFVQAN